ncbi:MAG: hypothetical protein AAGG09_22470, partial [Pseudomonadota bacterium]
MAHVEPDRDTEYRAYLAKIGQVQATWNDFVKSMSRRTDLWIAEIGLKQRGKKPAVSPAPPRDLPAPPAQVIPQKVDVIQARHTLQASIKPDEIGRMFTAEPTKKTAGDQRVLDALGEYHSLADKSGPEAQAALKETLRACSDWLRQTEDEAGQTIDKGDRYKEINRLHAKALEESIELSLKAKSDRGQLLDGGSDAWDSVRGIASFDAGLIDAYQEIRNNPDKGKNSRDAVTALQGILRAIPADGSAAAMRTAIEAEIADLEETWGFIDTMGSRDDERWATSRVWSPEGSAIRIESAQNCRDTNGASSPAGRPGTEEAQIRKFLGQIEAEASRSDVYAEVLKIIGNSDHPEPVPMSLGKYAAAFGDSAATGAVDMDTLDCLDDHPHEMEGTGEKVGHVRGELVLHFLEERIYMQGNGGDYADGHERCLKDNSLQNRYREELGQTDFSCEFSCAYHEHDAGHGDFRGTTSSGKVTVVRGVDLKAAAKPYLDRPALPKSEIEVVDVTENAQKQLEDAWAGCLRLIEQNVKYGTKGKEEFNALNRWIEMRYNGDAQQIKAAQTSYETAYNARLDAYNTQLAAAGKVNKELQQSRTERASLLLSEPPRNVESEYLASLRAGRAKTGGNDSAKNAVRTDWKSYTFEYENCAACTLGAITGTTSTGAVESFLESRGLPREKVDQFKGVQDHTLFYRAEVGALDPSVAFNGENLANDNQAPVVGDAQLRGIREMIAATVKKRNEADSDPHPPKELVAVQDGIPERGQMHDMDTLRGRMEKYPDGTQFQVFLAAGGFQHWVYAEVYNGKLVMEDYQLATDNGRDDPAGAAGYSDGAPQHPVNSQQDVFTEGMFIAITPKDAEGLPDPLLSADWPQIGSPEAIVIDLVVKASLKIPRFLDTPGALETAWASALAEHADALEQYRPVAKEIAAKLEAFNRIAGESGEVTSARIDRASVVLAELTALLHAVTPPQLRNTLEDRMLREVTRGINGLRVALDGAVKQRAMDDLMGHLTGEGAELRRNLEAKAAEISGLFGQQIGPVCNAWDRISPLFEQDGWSNETLDDADAIATDLKKACQPFGPPLGVLLTEKFRNPVKEKIALETSEFESDLASKTGSVADALANCARLAARFGHDEGTLRAALQAAQSFLTGVGQTAEDIWGADGSTAVATLSDIGRNLDLFAAHVDTNRDRLSARLSAVVFGPSRENIAKKSALDEAIETKQKASNPLGCLDEIEEINNGLGLMKNAKLSGAATAVREAYAEEQDLAGAKTSAAIAAFKKTFPIARKSDFNG